MKIQEIQRTGSQDPKSKQSPQPTKMTLPAGVKPVQSLEDNPIDENFADGRKPGRKGLSRRVGIPKKATLGQLEKIAKSSTGERRRMAQWQLNMRRGKKK